MGGDTTGVMVARSERLLVVHDPRYDLDSLYAVLRKSNIVRTASTASEAAEIATSVPVACVVCVVGRGVSARQSFDAIAGVSQSPPFVFLRSPEAGHDDDVFLITAGAKWLPYPVDAEKVLAAIQASYAKTA